jgi:hypothetical protein
VRAFLTVLIVVIFIIGGLQQAGKAKREERKRIETVCSRYSDPNIRNLIIDKRIWQGMTEQQLVDSWGLPRGRRQRVLKTKIKDTYSYGPRGHASTVQLDDGIVTGYSIPRGTGR